MICEYIKLTNDIRTNSGFSINGIEVKKGSTIHPYTSTIVARNNEVCQIDGRQSKDSFDLSVAYGDNESYVVKFWEHASNVGTVSSLVSMVGKMIEEKSTDALYETMIPKIFDAYGNQVGEYQFIAVERDGLQSYSYRKLVLNNVELNLYEVGVDKDIFICMYDNNDQMVATVQKRMPVKNGKSRYTMYMVNDQWFKYVSLATIILHHDSYDSQDGSSLGTSYYGINTYQEELKNKYNPNFIQEIINKEGTQNLPDNMPLVLEKVKASQNTIGLNFSRIMALIFAVGFGALVLYLFIFAK